MYIKGYKKRMLSLLLTCCFILAGFAVLPLGRAQAAEGESAEAATAEFRGVWVSTVLNLDYPSAATRDSETLAKEADELLDSIAAMGFTAVILQVRPCADAIYPSDLFPWSYYLSGEAGTAPKDDFDPLAYWVEGAHARGLELHAWLNPYRITKNTANHTIKTLDMLPKDSPARKNPGWVIKYGSDFYFNPALPEVRQYIADGVAEILANYDVDGIHMDDYFYPGQDFDDSADYARTGGKLSLADWRRENVNALIQLLYETVHSYDDVVFGVSPAGIWANSSTDSRGSATSGGEAYTQHYADTRRWVEEQWLDYIAPQIYWHIGHERADYKTLVEWWSELMADSPVKLYIGIAAYRVDGEGEAEAWQGSGEILRQLELNRATGRADGAILFRIGSLTGNDGLRAAVTDWFACHQIYPLAVTVPERNITTSLSSYYIGGTSDGRYPLTYNGEVLQSQTESGFFGMYVELVPGENVFAFTQNGQTVRRVITRKTKVAAPTGSAAAENCFPSSDYYTRPGYDIELSCTAPVGASVRAEFGGKMYVLYPDRYPQTTTVSGETTTFRAVITLPSTAKGLARMDAPVYTVRWGDNRSRTAAGGDLYLASENTALYAQFEYFAYAYEKASYSGGSINEFDAGMADNITFLSGYFAKLASGYWVSVADVKIQEGAISYRSIQKAAHSLSAGQEIIEIQKKGGTAAYAEFDPEAGILTLCVSPADSAPALTLQRDSIFKSYQRKTENGCAYYSFTLGEGAVLSGFYIETTKNGISLTVSPLRGLAEGAFPLSAHTIILDPGHGGSDSGTLGLLGSAFPEKDANLLLCGILAEKLRGLGATVILTREDDSYYSLEQRVALSRETRPDLYLSIHCNNMTYDTDMETIAGFSQFYRESVAATAAQTLFSVCKEETAGLDKGLHRTNLYVCRGSWCPALLFESAFMSNPADFQNLLNPQWQDAQMSALARGILAYFAGDTAAL